MHYKTDIVRIVCTVHRQFPNSLPIFSLLYTAFGREYETWCSEIEFKIWFIFQ